LRPGLNRSPPTWVCAGFRRRFVALRISVHCDTLLRSQLNKAGSRQACGVG
jgi:hypothetical protein